MHYVTDLHLHSKYSRAVSKDMTLPTMDRMARLKGLDILSVPDFTHTVWLKEATAQIEEAGEGVYRLKYPISNDKYQISNDEKQTLFIFATEISSIYKHKDKLRRIHNLVFAPSLKVAEKIGKALVGKGANIHSDGRPIIGLTSKNLLELVLSVDERAFLIPCHVWTPHFGMFGSASGYSSIEESFDSLSDKIYGIETGLSSDPEMNWQMEELADRSILSFSDAHSPLKMGREATVFELAEVSFANLKQAIMAPVIASKAKQSHKKGIAASPTAPRNDNRVVYTLEFYPEEGKYHFSGHRNCSVVRGPEEIAASGPTCPVCHRRLTEGVMYRVQTLAGSYGDTATAKENAYGLKWFTDPRKKHPPYVKLVPLLEIVAESMGTTVASKKVKEAYYKVCRDFGSELDVLLKTPIEDLQKTDRRLAEGVMKVRKGTIHIEPGYDNVYGVVKIWDEKGDPTKDAEADEAQLTLI